MTSDELINKIASFCKDELMQGEDFKYAYESNGKTKIITVYSILHYINNFPMLLRLFKSKSIVFNRHYFVGTIHSIDTNKSSILLEGPNHCVFGWSSDKRSEMLYSPKKNDEKHYKYENKFFHVIIMAINK